MKSHRNHHFGFMPPSTEDSDTANVRRQIRMRLKNALLAMVCMLFACGAGVAAQSPSQQIPKSRISRMFLDAHSPDEPKYSHSEIKKMVRDAKTSDDFMRLAEYFDYQAMEFEQKSQDELVELQRLLALPFHARSYPTQVDNTRDLITRYKAKAQECSARAIVYRKSASASSETK
jgi:hypothetical protein